jgi:hypothetical protein
MISFRYVFKQYYDLKYHCEQCAYLRGIQNLCLKYY